MKVLHYIPSLAKDMGQASRFAQTLHGELAKTVETRMYTGPITPGEWRKVLSDARPDIVHLHGSWDWHLALARYIAAKADCPVVLSPHGGLSQDVMAQDFFKRKLPRIVAYQFRLVRGAFVMHAATEQELAELKALGWKRRTCLIVAGEDEKGLAGMASEFRRLYQKVIDTWRRGRLTDEQRRAMFSLIGASVRADDTGEESSPFALPPTITQHDWLTLQIYAIDHGVHERLLAGAERFGAKIPEIVREPPSRFTKKPVLRLAPPPSTESKTSGDTQEARLATDVLHLQRMLIHHETTGHDGAPLALAADIYRKIRFGDYEEDAFLYIIDQAGLRPFTARLMHVLAEAFSLPTGFMPLDPVNDRQTRRLASELTSIEPIK